MRESRVVDAPEMVDAVSFPDGSFYHFLVKSSGHVIWDVEHDIGNDISDDLEGWRSELLEGEVITSRVCGLVSKPSIFKRECQTPVDLRLIS